MTISNLSFSSEPTQHTPAPTAQPRCRTRSHVVLGRILLLYLHYLNFHCIPSPTMLAIPKYIFKLFLLSFAVWIILSTAIPQISMKFHNHHIQTNTFIRPNYPYNSITSPTPLPIRNSTVYFVIGHPDDEVMFFSPSLVEISKPKHGNHVRLVCFSRGDAVHESFASIRSQELRASARIIGVADEDVIILDYKDGMDITWRSNDVAQSLGDIISTKADKNIVVITFDAHGVSGHANHISLYHGTKEFFRSKVGNNDSFRLYVLKSLNFWEKYSFTLLTNVELFFDLLSRHVFSSLLKINVNVSFFNQFNGNQVSLVKVYSDLNMLSVSYAAMAYGHFSQMVWFRYGWILFSRYLTYNHLVQIQ